MAKYGFSPKRSKESSSSLTWVDDWAPWRESPRGVTVWFTPVSFSSMAGEVVV